MSAGQACWQPDKVHPGHAPDGRLVLEAEEPQAGYVRHQQRVRWQGVEWVVQEIARPGPGLKVVMVVDSASNHPPADASKPGLFSRLGAQVAGQVALTAEVLHAFQRIPEIIRRLDDVEQAVRVLDAQLPKKPIPKPPVQG